MGTKHLTEADRLRARTLFFDAGLPKSRICEIMGFSLNQVKLAIREKTPKPRTGRPRRKPKPEEVTGVHVGISVGISAGINADPSTGAGTSASASARANISLNANVPGNDSLGGSGISTATSTAGMSIAMSASRPLARAPAPPTLSGRIHKPEQYEIPLPTSPFHREWPLKGTPARLLSMSSSASRAAVAAASASVAGSAVGRIAGPPFFGSVSHGSVASSAPSLLPSSSALYTASSPVSLVSPPTASAASLGTSTQASTTSSTTSAVSVPSLIIPPLQY